MLPTGQMGPPPASRSLLLLVASRSALVLNGLRAVVRRPARSIVIRLCVLGALFQAAILAVGGGAAAFAPVASAVSAGRRSCP